MSVHRNGENVTVISGRDKNYLLKKDFNFVLREYQNNLFENMKDSAI